MTIYLVFKQDAYEKIWGTQVTKVDRFFTTEEEAQDFIDDMTTDTMTYFYIEQKEGKSIK